MRVKQTARKSTATQSLGSATSTPGKDPLKRHMTALLHTKRKSTTPNTSHMKQETPGPLYTKRLPRQAKSTQNAVKIKPKSTNVLAEIKRYQKTWDLLVPRRPFHRLIREITASLSSEDEQQSSYKYQTSALEALQEAAEAYLVGLLEDSYLLTTHAKRVTLFVADIKLCCRLRSRFGI